MSAPSGGSRFPRFNGDTSASAVDEMMAICQAALPMTYMGNATLADLAYTDGELTISVVLPELDAETLAALDEPYLKGYLLEEWENLSFLLYELAEMNGDPITFLFYTAEGLKHGSVTIAPEVYHAL